MRAGIEPYPSIVRVSTTIFECFGARVFRINRLTSEGVLRREDTNDDDVRVARALAPADAVDTRVVDERREDELGGLVRRGGREDGDDHGGRPDGVPPDRDIVDVLEEVHAERVDEALADEDARVDADCDARFWDEGGPEGRERRDEIGCREAFWENSSEPAPVQGVISYLIPVVTATCPRRLNQPVTQEANAACWGSESMAAQKYGPPLVGCALHTSPMANPTIHVKTAGQPVEPSAIIELEGG